MTPVVSWDWWRSLCSRVYCCYSTSWEHWRKRSDFGSPAAYQFPRDGAFFSDRSCCRAWASWCSNTCTGKVGLRAQSTHWQHTVSWSPCGVCPFRIDSARASWSLSSRASSGPVSQCLSICASLLDGTSRFRRSTFESPFWFKRSEYLNGACK